MMDLVHESDVNKDRKFIVFESQLMQLFQRCHSCGLEVKLKTSIRGTLLVVNGVCPDGHILHWQSQPMVRGMAAGNLLLPAAVLLCGLTFTSIANLADVFNLAVFSESPGYSAKYGTYTLMDSATDLILDYSLVQVSEVGSSVAMEKEGLQRCLDKLLTQGVAINSIATDRHTGVASLMKKEYSFVDHQYDVWHMAKGVTKKLAKKAKTKHCGQIYPWIQSISNHLWWAAQTCNNDAQLLVEKWKSIVYHISNVHEWDSDPKALFPKCVHQTLSSEEERSRKWLRSGSVAHSALRKVVLQDTLLRDMKKLVGFHHTGSLEVFHSLLLKYCPKRQHFSYVGMQARIELAILDHNYNTQRKQATTKDGTKIIILHLCLTYIFTEGKARYLIVFPKGRKSWVAKPILEEKDYTHLCHIMEDVVQLRLDEHRQELFDYDKSDFIPQNIASIERPPKQEVITQHISRFPTRLHSNNSQQ